jgi:hypothetical protein
MNVCKRPSNPVRLPPQERGRRRILPTAVSGVRGVRGVRAMVASFEPGEDRRQCYADEALV